VGSRQSDFIKAFTAFPGGRGSTVLSALVAKVAGIEDAAVALAILAIADRTRAGTLLDVAGGCLANIA